MTGPLSLKQLCVVQLREDELYDDIRRLPPSLKWYVASCLKGTVWDVGLVLRSDEEAQELYQRYERERRLLLCRECLYCERRADAMVIVRRTETVYRFCDSDTSHHRCCCCGEDAWTPNRYENDDRLMAYILKSAIDTPTVQRASRHSGYRFY